MSYIITVATFISIQAIVAYGLNIIVGYAGQISLGHAAFFGIGAYSAGLLATKAGLSFWAALPLVVAICAVIGIICGLPSLRLKADFLAITTIGINFIVESLFLYVPFFGGALGLGGIPRVVFLGNKLKGGEFLTLCLLFLASVMFLSWWFSRSWMGLACISLREEETAASSMGVSPVKFKLVAFVLGSVIAGIGGALYAHQMRFIAPSDFGFPVSVMLLSLIVLGGMGTFWGPLVGAIILGSLPELARPLMEYRMLIYSLLLLGMIRFQPQGLLGEESVVSRIIGRHVGGDRS
ncbi:MULTISPECIES: branched-chain amino acid ABC transporter permease [Dethiosulfovibrio]|jgi:branched-chain amino acid transport system permease protein|uniref:Branched-chain amino acid ABC transporter permease n=2 Tax=Dethiosulfovibrio TaxID=47054 RepID=A0ABS9EQ42_9BACT|nr:MULTISPECIES: branched-chain amino acid ABC transporter permease [Dethiosulfovibrio]MCF4114316.1 branched-chain amino acid ABC transporter permease [Dethiosulfovibrio russensis]MCF4143308.1 branched-chain amino acid ABC transporter permease [Dethiosulfovibrio marinus]MCF4145477.1 branched-chain amino acid ABC transporter permease [Dethiosulfovibrio acidaminovorans]MEA3285089.1 branched-chain amino acid ABC transporter permease [Synergistota bacterium]